MKKNIMIIFIAMFPLWLVACGLWSMMVEAAGPTITLRVVVVNPSKDKVKKVPVKAYLPKELKPQDVLDKEDLEVAYDTQQGTYYVFGEYELKPKEVLEKQIEIQDIWIIPDAELTSLRLEVERLSGLLKDTEFIDRVNFLKDGIISKLNQIEDNQKNAPPNPERHIFNYRENLKILDGAKADMVLLRGFLAQSKSLPTKIIWQVMLAIIIFLAVLGIGFYIIWQKQAKVVSQDTFFTPQKEDLLSSQEQKPAE